jgi:transposase
VVPACEFAKALQEIKALQRVLGKKTLENEILREAVEYGRSKNSIARSPLLPHDDRRSGSVRSAA